MNEKASEPRFTEKVQVQAWLYDKDAQNLTATMLLRYHREGWCSRSQPYGTRVAPVGPVDGNPNDFGCPHCGLHFRRVLATEAQATELIRTDRKNFDGHNAPTGVDSLPVSAQVLGCDCVTGHEHSMRGEHPQPATGTVPDGLVVVPMVWGKFAVEMENRRVTAARAERPLTPDQGRGFVPPDFDNPFATGGEISE